MLQIIDFIAIILPVNIYLLLFYTIFTYDAAVAIIK